MTNPKFKFLNPKGYFFLQPLLAVVIIGLELSDQIGDHFVIGTQCYKHFCHI